MQKIEKKNQKAVEFNRSQMRKSIQDTVIHLSAAGAERAQKSFQGTSIVSGQKFLRLG